MFELNNLLLLSGNDIPFPEMRTTFHPLRVREIAYLGEKTFYTAVTIFNINKKQLKVEDNLLLKDTTNFDIFMSIMLDKDPFSIARRNEVILIMDMLFPRSEVILNTEGLFLLEKENEEATKIPFTSETFDKMVEMLDASICIDYEKENEELTGLAAQIKAKIEAGKRKKAELEGTLQQEVTILLQYTSIIAIGNHLDLNVTMDYTVYQIYDQLKRLQLKENSDTYITAKIAGAKGMNEVDNWMDNIHDNK